MARMSDAERQEQHLQDEQAAAANHPTIDEARRDEGAKERYIGGLTGALRAFADVGDEDSWRRLAFIEKFCGESWDESTLDELEECLAGAEGGQEGE